MQDKAEQMYLAHINQQIKYKRAELQRAASEVERLKSEISRLTMKIEVIQGGDISPGRKMTELGKLVIVKAAQLRGLRRKGTKAQIAAAEKELAGLKKRAKKEAKENRNARLKKLRALKSGRAI